MGFGIRDTICMGNVEMISDRRFLGHDIRLVFACSSRDNELKTNLTPTLEPTPPKHALPPPHRPSHDACIPCC